MLSVSAFFMCIRAVATLKMGMFIAASLRESKEDEWGKKEDTDKNRSLTQEKKTEKKNEKDFLQMKRKPREEKE